MTPTSHDRWKLGDHEYQLLQLLNDKTQAPSFTIPNHVLSNSNIQERESYCPTKGQLENHEPSKFASEGGSSNNKVLNLCLWKTENRQGYNISGRHYQKFPTKWLPSKLRLVRKMMNSNRAATKSPSNLQIEFEENQKQGSSSANETTDNSNNSSSSIIIRVCSDCNTTKTPLWRSGPQGPKSLCNACGIRQRKARRALAAAAAAVIGTTQSVEGKTCSSKPKVQQNCKGSKINTKISACKKRSELGENNERKTKLCLEDFFISLSKNMAFHQVFPQDEKEAAILLMALSSGLVHG